MATKSGYLRLLVVLVASVIVGFLVFQYTRSAIPMKSQNYFYTLIENAKKTIVMQKSWASKQTQGTNRLLYNMTSANKASSGVYNLWEETKHAKPNGASATKSTLPGPSSQRTTGKPTTKVTSRPTNPPTRRPTTPLPKTTKHLATPKPTVKLTSKPTAKPTAKPTPKPSPKAAPLPKLTPKLTPKPAAQPPPPKPEIKYDPSMFPNKNPPVPYDHIVVPKIVHYAWYSDKKLTFRFHHFISMLSAYKHIQPTKVMFWYEKAPEGDWWAKIRERVPIIEMKYRKGPTEIHGNPVNVPEHKSDIVRLEAVMEYGGIYTDLDVIVLKSFDPILKYNTTMGNEGGNGAQNGLCNGIIISRPHATFLEIWHKEYKSFKDGQWAIHSVILPFQLAGKYPSLIHKEEKTLHRPNWLETKWLYNTGFIYDWSKNYAIHLWYRFHNIDHTPEDIKTLNTTMGQMFRYIYYGKKDLIL